MGFLSPNNSRSPPEFSPIRIVFGNFQKPPTVRSIADHHGVSACCCDNGRSRGFLGTVLMAEFGDLRYHDRMMIWVPDINQMLLFFIKRYFNIFVSFAKNCDLNHVRSKIMFENCKHQKNNDHSFIVCHMLHLFHFQDL